MFELLASYRRLIFRLMAASALSAVPFIAEGSNFAAVGVNPEASQEDFTQEEASAMPEIQASKVGPWGQIEYFEALLEAPLGLIRESQPNSFRTRWFFGKMDADATEAFLGTLELPKVLEEEINSRELWLNSSEGTSIYPKISQIEKLPEKSRIKLYRYLAKWPENRYHCEPEIIYGNSVAKWTGGLKFSPEVTAFIEKVSYSSASALLFADTPAVLSLAKSENERLQILRAFSRTPTLVAKLRIKAASRNELAEYWNRGIRFKDTSTFLDSMLRYGALEKVDLVHFLPAGIRKILYTFPSPSQTRSGYLPDCHWSSLNFFNPEPVERLSDPPQATAYTLENFTKVSPPYQLGDVLFFTDVETGDAYHSCAYIADDIVFTKNGRSPLQPWVLMKLEQVKIMYDLHFHTETTGYRRKFQN
ncbi:MAG: hypothetical protein EBS01_07370 [Verrucomicrobia bacterium]|nr:hypothetical protein [Verrucomicrobiota bacterium]